MTDTRPTAHPGDGWLHCSCGRRHWGLCGAAGLFLVRLRAEEDTPVDVLLQHRAIWSDQGGTWGIPGGAIAVGETARQGALREAREEAGIDPDDIDVVATMRLDHRDWAYTTLLAVTKPGHAIAPVVTDRESIAVEWVSLDKVAQLPLLRAFGQQLPLYRRALARGLRHNTGSIQDYPKGVGYKGKPIL